MAIAITEAQKLVAGYSNWLRDKTVLKEVNDDYLELTTPYLDRHNDCLQIYLHKDRDGYILSDDGHTITDLRNSGCNLDSSKRQDILKTTLNGFGVLLDGEQLKVRATSENFPLKKHNLLQAILSINDLFYLASPNIESLFLEDVATWLNLLEVRFIPQVKFTGRSGFDHMFDYVIPKSKYKPERILQTINNPRKDAAEVLVFQWLDTKEMRSADTKLIPVLNDREYPAPSSVVDALLSYELNPILWSQRESARDLVLN